MSAHFPSVTPRVPTGAACVSALGDSTGAATGTTAAIDGLGTSMRIGAEGAGAASTLGAAGAGAGAGVGVTGAGAGVGSGALDEVNGQKTT